jgi:hypothetical protein
MGSRGLAHWRPREDELAGRPRDIAAGHIEGHGALGDKTLGFFWSRVMPTQLTTSIRDINYNQRLRSTYSYFRTPLVAITPPPSPSPPWLPCLPDCGLFLDMDDPLINPADAEILWPYQPARVFEENGGFVLTGGPDDPVYDVSAFLSAPVKSLLQARSTEWLKPIEGGVRARALGETTRFVALPDPWQPSGVVNEIVYDHGQFNDPPPPGGTGATRSPPGQSFSAAIFISAPSRHTSTTVSITTCSSGSPTAPSRSSCVRMDNAYRACGKTTHRSSSRLHGRISASKSSTGWVSTT